MAFCWYRVSTFPYVTENMVGGNELTVIKTPLSSYDLILCFLIQTLSDKYQNLIAWNVPPNSPRFLCWSIGVVKEKAGSSDAIEV